jgi:S-methylmethionine-dependent homocysteine/selenocysteine methylase
MQPLILGDCCTLRGSTMLAIIRTFGNDILLPDGGTGSELECRGIDIGLPL